MSKKRSYPLRGIIDPYILTNYTSWLTPKPVAPIVHFDDAPTICLSLSIHLVPHLIGLLETVVWLDKWIGTDEEKRIQVGVIRELQNALMGGNCVIDPCCPDEIEKLQQLIDLNITFIENQTTIIEQNYDVIVQNEYQEFNSWVSNNLEMNMFNEMMYDGTPESIYPDVGATWGEDDGILCAAIRRYVDYVIYAETLTLTQEAQLLGAITAAAAAAAIAAAAPTAGIGAIAGIVVGAAGALIGFTYNNWLQAMNDPEKRRDVYCCMYDSLKDSAVTLASFQGSVSDCGFDPFSSEANIASRLHAYNQVESSYTAFLRMLSQTTSGNADDCACDCDSDLELVDFGGTGTDITHIGNCIYRFVQSTPVDIGGGTLIWRHSFKDAGDRCLFIENTGDPAHPTAAVGYFTEIHDCAGVYDDFPGGFDGGTLRDVKWWNGGGGTTYYKITLAE